MKTLWNSRVAVFGIGGVGGYAAEALARSGIGQIDLIDSDRVCLTNLNRQIIALHNTIGLYKTDVMKERIAQISPDTKVTVHRCFFLPENADTFPFAQYDYVIDAVDTVTAKIALVMKAQEHHTPIISCMGAGNKLDPTQFRVAQLSKTKVCPLAKVMRRELKKRGIEKLKVVYSEEIPREPIPEEESGLQGMEAAPNPENQQEIRKFTDETRVRRASPGSVAFVPPVAGLILAGEVIKDLSVIR